MCTLGRKPTLEDAKLMPREYYEMPNDVLLTLAASGDFGAKEERLIREIMAVDALSWQDAQPKFGEISAKAYEGKWAGDSFSGRGIMWFRNGDRYDGNWSMGRRHGSGLLLLSGGAKFEGNWSMGVRCGEGIFTTADGVSTRLCYD